LKSTTAPNKVFETRDELAEHYKSDLHKYNLKRKEQGLSAVTEEEFRARLEAAWMLRREELERKNKKVDHVKEKNRNKKSSTSKNKDKNVMMKETTFEDEEDDQNVDPKQCLFSNETFDTVKENIEHMENHYSFFIPDREYLIDEEGLIGYCTEKINLGHVCLFCQKAFQSSQDCKKHMASKGHCMLRYEAGIDLHEFEVFYDFSKVNKDFLGNKDDEDEDDYNDMVESEDDEEWEDVDSEVDEVEKDDAFYDGYKKVIQKHGFGVTELGELILPSGKTIGHRDLSVFYKQRFAPTSNALIPSTPSTDLPNKSKALSGAGNGKGILVQNAFSKYTKVSLYRYRAALRKERRDVKKAQRQEQKYQIPINKLDKKGNRMITNVSVAHALR